MKKISYLIISFVLLITAFAFPLTTGNVQAKTLRQLKQELANKEAEYNNNKQKKQMTQNEINVSKNRIAEINKEVAQIQTDIENLKAEIEKLNVEIEEKKKEVKQIMNYYQVSSGENAYLEYAFGATSITDMAYIFNGCYSIELVDLSNFYAPKLVTMSSIFYESTSLKTINLSNIK